MEKKQIALTQKASTKNSREQTVAHSGYVQWALSRVSAMHSILKLVAFFWVTFAEGHATVFFFNLTGILIFAMSEKLSSVF